MVKLVMLLMSYSVVWLNNPEGSKKLGKNPLT